jgi:hypothetical protein
MSNENHIELRLPGSGWPYVAVLGGTCPRYGIERIFDPFRLRCEYLPSGQKEVIHLLPDADLTYEVEEVRDGKRLRWYAATVAGDPQIHRISRYGAELVARKRISIPQAVHEFPEMPKIEVEDGVGTVYGSQDAHPIIEQL